MPFLNEPIDLSDLPESTGGDFKPIPAGWYQTTIAGAEVKSTKAGTGQYISVRFDITGPSHQGRVMFTNLNIRNSSPKVQEIGLRQLGDIMRAGGLASIQDTDQLIGINLEIKVTIKRDPEYGPKSEVKAFKAISGSAAPSASPPHRQQPNAGKLPWQK